MRMLSVPWLNFLNGNILYYNFQVMLLLVVRKKQRVIIDSLSKQMSDDCCWKLRTRSEKSGNNDRVVC